MSCSKVRWAAQTPLVMTPCGGHPLPPETVHLKYFTFLGYHQFCFCKDFNHIRLADLVILKFNLEVWDTTRLARILQHRWYHRETTGAQAASQNGYGVLLPSWPPQPPFLF